MRKIRRKKHKKQTHLVIGTALALLFLFTAGYAAFGTNISITAKGNMKNLKEEVDSKVPTNDLLFWGQADNEDNTLTILKDKSNNGNDGVMYNFNNTDVSGYTNGELIFDGVDDYVNIGLANYDFKNSQSIIMYIKVFDTSTYGEHFNNFEVAGSGINGTNYFRYEIYDGTNNKYVGVATENNFINQSQYYTIIGMYDGANVKLYVDGVQIGYKKADSLKTSTMPIIIGANPDSNDRFAYNSHISLKEAMLYDRALTEDEVKIITNGFNRKYK